MGAVSVPGISSGFPWLPQHERMVRPNESMRRTTDYEADAGTQSHWQ